ncbi:MAG TPA: transglutaminase-like domain-containing protein [Kiloniellaceae bacterium]|nr:transglutaminase-like domain-containing protein [Kiloniellaceae bacterium]
MAWSSASGRDEIKAALRVIGRCDDETIDIGEAALLLAALDRPRVPLARYRQHLSDLAAETAGEAGGPDAKPAVVERLSALNRVIVERHGYRGDSLTYDDLQNANLIRVIDRRRGLPVALSILYMHAARAQAWRIEGLNFPGHFLLRMETDGERCIFDPFNAGRILDTPALRLLIKSLGGEAAELSPIHTAAVSSRDVLLRLQNNIKLRLLQQNRAEDAVETIDSMLLLAPEKAESWRELGLLHSHLGNLRAAILAFENVLQLSDDHALRQDAAQQLQALKTQLN